MAWVIVVLVLVVLVAVFIAMKKKGGGEAENVEAKINRALIQEDGNKVIVQLFVATSYNDDLKCFFSTSKDKAPTKEDLKIRDKVVLKGVWDQSTNPYTFKVKEIVNTTQNKSFKS
ncbi:MAG: hypothetical protein PHD88_02500 [Firmicutes bacterium]|nr:hypothetical protein [Bacillota bacterium]MDD4263023.1 hypothetical protein [Bacillota bacterium]MDD4693262.1 hypothetical protein [Bacillota bacterium]